MLHHEAWLSVNLFDVDSEVVKELPVAQSCLLRTPAGARQEMNGVSFEH